MVKIVRELRQWHYLTWRARFRADTWARLWVAGSQVELLTRPSAASVPDRNILPNSPATFYCIGRWPSPDDQVDISTCTETVIPTISNQQYWTTILYSTKIFLSSPCWQSVSSPGCWTLTWHCPADRPVNKLQVRRPSSGRGTLWTMAPAVPSGSLSKRLK